MAFSSVTENFLKTGLALYSGSRFNQIPFFFGFNSPSFLSAKLHPLAPQIMPSGPRRQVGFGGFAV